MGRAIVLIEVQPVVNAMGVKTGYNVLRTKRVVATFSGDILSPEWDSVRDAAYDYAQNLLDDLRYEAERS